MVSSTTPGSGIAGGGGHICSIKNDIGSLLGDSNVGGCCSIQENSRDEQEKDRSRLRYWGIY